MQRLGVVDLGSNTARLVVYGYEPGRWFRLVDEIRAPIRLGEGLGRGRELSPAAIRRAVAALELFHDYRLASGLERLEVIATSALRDAANREDFFAGVAPLDLSIHVLSGQQEAELGVTAVANGFTLTDAWVVDLGGGSAQLSFMRQRRFAEGRAYPLGTVRLTEAFLRSDPPSAGEVRSLEERIEEELGEVVADLRRSSWPLVVMGGTIRNLAQAVQRRAAYPLNLLHGYELARRDLENLTAELLTKSAAKRAKIPGISADRADVIVAGALVFRWLLRRGRRESLLVSGQGVREGFFQRDFFPAPHLVGDVRAFSVENLLHQYPQPAPHVDRVRRLAFQLFTGLAPLHGLGSQEAEILDAAAALHDIGMTLSYHRHDKHGLYLLSSAPIDGFDHREQALIGLLVRYHRRGSPKAGGLGEVLAGRDKRVLPQLVACLRLAEQLERSRAGRVLRVEVEVGARRVVIRAEADEDPTIELWEARKHAGLFALAFGRKLVLERGRSRPSSPTA